MLETEPELFFLSYLRSKLWSLVSWYDNPKLELTLYPQSDTMNLATAVHRTDIGLEKWKITQPTYHWWQFLPGLLLFILWIQLSHYKNTN